MRTALSLALLLSVSSLASPAFAADKTARALLPQATAEAKKWQPDSVLVNIETESASPTGTAPAWGYTYYSQKTKKSTLVVADGKDKPLRLDSMYRQTTPIGEFTVDSDTAMATAVKNGLKTHNFGMIMRLESHNGKPEWQMLDREHFYYVDAVSGRFLRKKKTD